MFIILVLLISLTFKRVRTVGYNVKVINISTNTTSPFSALLLITGESIQI
jgi:hypothetical protein